MELSNFFNRQSEIVFQFKDNYPDIWEMLNGAYLVSNTVISEISSLNVTFKDHELQVFLYWHMTLDYQIESLSMIIRKQIDAGLGCLRLASELTRNSARLLEQPELLSVLRGATGSDHETMVRRSFKFKVADPEEKLLFDLYKMTSKYGIHGHNTGDILRTPVFNKGEKVQVTIKDEEILKMLSLWMTAFFPIQNIFVNYFGSKFSVKSVQYYLDYITAFNSAMSDFKKNIQ